MSVSSEFAEQLKRFIAVIILTNAIFGYVNLHICDATPLNFWHEIPK